MPRASIFAAPKNGRIRLTEVTEFERFLLSFKVKSFEFKLTGFHDIVQGDTYFLSTPKNPAQLWTPERRASLIQANDNGYRFLPPLIFGDVTGRLFKTWWRPCSDLRTIISAQTTAAFPVSCFSDPPDASGRLPLNNPQAIGGIVFFGKKQGHLPTLMTLAAPLGALISSGFFLSDGMLAPHWMIQGDHRDQMTCALRPLSLE